MVNRLLVTRTAASLAVIRVAMVRRDIAAVAGFAAGSYTVLYLWAIGNVSISPGAGIDARMVANPLGRMTEMAPGSYTFEAVALVEIWVITLLLSPLNAVIASGVGVLVGLNVALAYLAIVRRQRCGMHGGAGVLAALPALLAGSACCAPGILLAVGVLMTGSVLAVLPWLLPASVLLLIVSLVLVGDQIHSTTGDSTDRCVY